VLKRIEERYGVRARGSLPERVKGLRRAALEKLESLANESPERSKLQCDLDDLFLVVQLFSYPGDYVAERPTIERIAETLDKFEEDILRVPLAPPRGARSAVVTFGEPVAVEANARTRDAAAALTETLEQRVQTLLDGIAAPPPITTVPEDVCHADTT
jgi:hypothetical protein